MEAATPQALGDVAAVQRLERINIDWTFDLISISLADSSNYLLRP